MTAPQPPEPSTPRPTLENTVALLQATLDATHDGILVVDVTDHSSRIVLYNQQYLRMFRFTAERVDAGGIDWVAATIEEQLQNPEVMLRQGGKRRGDVAQEDRQIFRFKDGRVFERFAAPRFVNSRMVGRVLSYRDITEAVHTQQALEQHRSFLENAQEAAHIGSWVSELDGSSRLGWSAETFRIFGVSPTQFGGTTDAFFELVHPDDREVVRAAFSHALYSSDRYEVEHRILRPDGAVRWVHELATMMRDGQGSAIRAIGTVQDVTERRQLEGQLRQSQKLEAIGRLAGGVAHDLNNALTAIAGFTELALTTLDADHPARPDVQEIRSAAERAEAVTRQLLAFSRRQMLEPRVFSLSDSVLNLQRFLERMLGADITMEASAPVGLPPVYGDPGQIEQAILNLAVNARDAMTHGGCLRIAVAAIDADESFVRTRQPMRPGPYLELTVSDTGHGMDATVLAQIFEPFFTTKAVGKGTGLGLSMVYGTVKQSGGFIFVESTPGQGSAFRIYLPPAPSAKLPQAETRTRAAQSETPTILVVEDERPVRTVVVTSLLRAGMQVLQAADAEEALTVLSSTLPLVDLVLTDATMPGMSGVDLARRLLRDRPTLPVIIMSGFTQEALTLGDIQHRVMLLSKPFTPREVQSKVAEALNRR